MNITDTRNWQMSLKDPLDIVEGGDDIIQCIYIILTTIPGSDPLRPTFGSNIYQYIDKPLREVQAKIVYEATETIAKWEKRFKITKCNVEADGTDGITITVTGNIVGSAKELTIPVKL